MNICECPDDRYLQEDLDRIAQSNLPFEEFRNKTFLITGATGLIGSLVVKALACCNRVHHLNLRMLLLVRNEEKAQRVFSHLLKRPEVVLVIGDITNEIRIEQPVDYVIHGASVTTSKTMVHYPVETIMTALHGTENMLKLAKEKQVRSMIYLSSMEVYGNIDAGDQLVTESMSGYINPLKVRSNYPESKRMCENLCVSYCSEYGVHVKIARLAQTFGAGVLPVDNRVFAQFAKSAIAGKDIILHTKGESEGNYCYTSDVVKALLLLLIRGENGQAYNVSNEATHIKINQMAEMVAKRIADGKISVIYDITADNVYGYAQDTKLKLSSEKMRELGWSPEIDLESAYRRMIGSMTSGS